MNIKDRINQMKTDSNNTSTETDIFCEKDVFILTDSVKEKLKQAIEAGKNIVIETKTGETKGISISCIDNIIPVEDSDVIFIENEVKNTSEIDTIQKTNIPKPNKYKLLKEKLKKKRVLDI